MTRVHCSTESQGEDMAGAGLAQGFRADIHRRAGCKDVIDQQDTFAGDGLRPWHGKGSTEIVQAFSPRECCLGRCRGNPGQRRGGDREV